MIPHGTDPENSFIDLPVSFDKKGHWREIAFYPHLLRQTGVEYGRNAKWNKMLGGNHHVLRRQQNADVDYHHRSCVSLFQQERDKTVRL
jgi:hypothetical protein